LARIHTAWRIATIRFGEKWLRCLLHARDVSAEFLGKVLQSRLNDAPLHTHCKRSEVESGKVKLVRTAAVTIPCSHRSQVPEAGGSQPHGPGPSSYHGRRRGPASYCSLGPSIPSQGDVRAEVSALRRETPFASQKSKAVPVSERSSCAGRDPWYDLTKSKPGCMFGR